MTPEERVAVENRHRRPSGYEHTPRRYRKRNRIHIGRQEPPKDDA